MIHGYMLICPLLFLSASPGSPSAADEKDLIPHSERFVTRGSFPSQDKSTPDGRSWGGSPIVQGSEGTLTIDGPFPGGPRSGHFRACYRNLRIHDVIPLYGRFYQISQLRAADVTDTMAIEVTRLADTGLPSGLPTKVSFLTAPSGGWLVVNGYRIHVARITAGDAKTAMPASAGGTQGGVPGQTAPSAGARATLEIGIHDTWHDGKERRLEVSAGDRVEVRGERLRVVRVFPAVERVRELRTMSGHKWYGWLTGWVEFEPVKTSSDVKAGTETK